MDSIGKDTTHCMMQFMYQQLDHSWAELHAHDGGVVGVAGDSNKCLNDECRLSWGYKGLVVRPMENGFDVFMHGS